MKNTYEEFQFLVNKLTFADNNEHRATAFWLMEHFANASQTDILTKNSIANFAVNWQPMVDRLNAHEPIQYVIGETNFYGRNFLVTPDVLIPRPETEELVELVLNEIRDVRSPKIVDIGTGSGCIAISLAAESKDASVVAFDISKKALQVAESNAKKNEVKINFIEQDILQPTFHTIFDVIVSNPPYVKEEEKALMKSNVLNFEPHLALFVKNERPLIFYEAIAAYAKKNLTANGKLFVEINGALGQETAACFNSYGFGQTNIIKDIHGKERFVIAAR